MVPTSSGGPHVLGRTYLSFTFLTALQGRAGAQV